MKKNSVKILICIIILISLPLSVFAVQKAIKPTSQKGEYDQKLIDRVNLSVENTDFVVTKTADGEETFYITFTFSAQKTEADFYAKINSFSISGIEFENIIFNIDFKYYVDLCRKEESPIYELLYEDLYYIIY